MKRSLSICCLLALLCTVPGMAWAGLSGSADLRYGGLQEEQDGQQVAEGSWFAHQYSMVYQKKGDLAKGRAGRYDFRLGYEWNSISKDMSGTLAPFDGSQTTDKVLFKGDVLIAPGGLPFNLHLYSMDLGRSTFQEAQPNSLFMDFEGLRDTLPDPLAGINNGQRIRTGATLKLGIRNGSYLGRYRDTLSRLPRLLVDYWQTSAKDLPNGLHYRDRNLAFISLNKKDNWLHYRMFEHRDMINPENDLDESTWLLGTVDATYRRKWINLTNWLQVSADGSLTTGKSVSSGREDFENYDMRLFAKARRPTWSGSSLNIFSRNLDKNQQALEKSLEVPLYLQGEIDSNTSWRLRLLSSKENKLSLSDGVETDDTDLYGSARAELFRQSRYLVAPELQAEIIRGTGLEGESFRVSAEAYTNRSFNPTYDLFGSYSAGFFSGGDGSGLDNDFLEHRLLGRVETNIGSHLRTGVEQVLLLGNGQLGITMGGNLSPFSREGFRDSGTTGFAIDGTVFRSTTKWFGEHRKGRLSNRVRLIYDYLSRPDKEGGQFELEYKLQFENSKMRVSWDNALVKGGDVLQSKGTLLGGGYDANSRFFSRGKLRYSPTRNLSGSVDFDYEWQDSAAASSASWRASEEVKYRIMKINGIIRKLAEFRQKILYERGSFLQGAEVTTTEFSAAADYHPTRAFFIGGEARYRLEDGQEESDAWAFVARAGADFTKLKVGLTYAYGDQTKDDVIERNEQRWEVQVKKAF